MSTISHVTEPSGMRRLIYRGHGDAYSTVAWSPDGNLLATGGVTGLIHLWNAVTGAGVTTCEEDFFLLCARRDPDRFLSSQESWAHESLA